MSSLSDFIGGASSSLKNSGSTAITGALSQAAQGNVAGAASLLTSSVQDSTSTLGASGGSSFGDDFAGMQQRGDAVQNWCWYAVLPDISNPNAVSAGAISIGTQTVGIGQPLVSCPWYYVTSANLPQREFQTEDVKRNGHSVQYPTSYSVGALTLGMFMDSESKVHQYLKAWQAQVMGNQNPKVVANQGSWGYPADFKKDITLVVLSVRRNVLLNVKLINCWPTQASALELTSGEAAGLTQEVTFSVEDVDITVNNDKGLLDTLLTTGSGYASSALGSVLSGAVNNVFTTLGI